MAVELYQRAEPRQKNWLPLLSQQIRLRNITQIALVNVDGGFEEEEKLVYFTLHISPMSAPFYTSPKVGMDLNLKKQSPLVVWPEIQVSLCSVRLSVEGVIVRVWTGGGGSVVVTWGVHFKGLHYLGQRGDWNASDFKKNTLIFFTPFGSFTSIAALITQPVTPQRFLTMKIDPDAPLRSSYKLKDLNALHSLQRSVLEEHALGEKYKTDIGLYGFQTSSQDNDAVEKPQPIVLSERLKQRAKLGRQRLQIKQEIEAAKIRVNFLEKEKQRAAARIQHLKEESDACAELCEVLIARMRNFASEKTNLKEVKTALITKGQSVSKFKSSVSVRKKQLISELLQIYPFALVEGSKRYSINGVQLPNAEDYTNETGAQMSVALGYTAHFVAMLAFFLDVPCRYPIRHFGSRSRIVDHITVQIPDREREFPLYFKGKRDVYSAYALYLLNKNIAQLRWYCGLSTPDLRATLPNLVELLTNRLIIPGWPPDLESDTLEIAQELTEDIGPQFLEAEPEPEEQNDSKKDLSSLVSGDPLLPDSVVRNGNPGGNIVVVGDVHHGRGQERFLSGWKKKTYGETDDFDPKWLTDSMKLDFDAGRRISISNSSPPAKPSFVVSNHEDAFTFVRKRRVGHVDPPSLESIDSAYRSRTSEQGRDGRPALKRVDTSQNIVRLEVNIKEFERRKSRGTSSSIGIPFGNSSEGQHNFNHSRSPFQSGIWEAAEAETNQGTKEEYDEDNIHIIGGEVVDFSEHPASTGLPSSRPLDIDQLHEESAYHIPPPVEQLNDDNDVSNSDVTVVVTSSSSVSTCDDETTGPVQQNDCDKDNFQGSSSSKNVNAEDNCEDSVLWMRTEALLSAQSFNLVRRRMSASDPS